MLLAFHPHLMVMFSLNSPLLIIQVAILARCKELMDTKYDGHFWCKVKTTNINNDFNIGMLLRVFSIFLD